MILSPPLRKLALTAHVASSVGWFGAVTAALALALAGLTGRDLQIVRGAYLTLEVVGWYVLVPLSLASLLTGLVSSLGTTWGLFRHYWVIFKLLMNLVASIVLLMYMPTLGVLADVAANPSLSDSDLLGFRSPSPVLHAGVALVLLTVAIVLGVYKPRGLTRFGRREQAQQRAAAQ